MHESYRGPPMVGVALLGAYGSDIFGSSNENLLASMTSPLWAKRFALYLIPQIIVGRTSWWNYFESMTYVLGDTLSSSCDQLKNVSGNSTVGSL